MIEQTYPGYDDHRKHFNILLKAFTDKRYVTVDGKHLFFIFQPHAILEVEKVTAFWREMAEKSGLKGLYLVGFYWVPFGFLKNTVLMLW